MHLTVLPTLLKLATLKDRNALPSLMHPISSQILSPSKNSFFNFTFNKSDISFILTEDLASAFPAEKLEFSSFLYKALQVDDIGIDQSGERIHELSVCLANAGISIFYLTTYQADFVLMREDAIQKAFEALKAHFHVDSPTTESISVDLSTKSAEMEELHKKESRSSLDFDILLHSERLQIAGINFDASSLASGVILKAIFFDPKVEFFSYTITPEGISVIASEDQLEYLPETVLHLGIFDSSLRLLEVDVREFSLEHIGIVKSLSAPLVESQLNVLLMSTFSSANTLLKEADLDRGLQIMRERGVIKSLKS